MTPFQIITGSIPSQTIRSVTSVFSRSDAIVASAGDYSSDLVTESGSHLYFSDLRAQNALSGALSTFSSQVSSLSGIVYNLTGTGLIELIADINAFTGYLATTNNTLISYASGISVFSGNIATFSGNMATF